jgi:tetratricopeptide (TPR) repeat protein
MRFALTILPFALLFAAADDLDRAMAILRAGKVDEAIPLLSRIAREKPENAEASYFLGLAQLQKGLYDDARQAFENALRHASPERKSSIHRSLALTRAARNEPVQAERHFVESLRLYGSAQGGQDPRVDYGAFLVRQGRAKEAVPLLEQAVEAKSDSPRAHAELGRALMETGRLEAAAASLEKAVAFDGNPWTARLLLGKLYLKLGRVEEGERQMRLGREGWARENQGSSTVR